MAVEVQVVLGGGKAGQDGGVDLGGEHGGPWNAGHVEPPAAEPDPLAGPDAVDPQPLGGHRAEYGDGFVRGGGVEVAALGDAGADGSRQPETGRLDRQAIGVDGGDDRAAVDRYLDRPGVLYGGGPPRPAAHSWCPPVQFRPPPPRALPLRPRYP